MFYKRRSKFLICVRTGNNVAFVSQYIAISLEPHVKSLHLTLAYQFPSSQYTHLKTLVESLDPSNSNNWELRLYSRDPRVNGKQVHKVIHPYAPSEYDELELRAGDYVYLSNEALANSPDGWVEGTSWLTGLTGLLPESYTERTAESDAWTLHKKISLNNLSPCCDTTASPKRRMSQTNPHGTSNQQLIQSVTEALSKKLALQSEHAKPTDILSSSALNTDEVSMKLNDVTDGTGSREAITDIPEVSSHPDTNSGEETYENLQDVVHQDSPKEISGPDNQSRKLFILRHGERVDFTFGTWIPYCFDSSGNYLRKDLNMPRVMPERQVGPQGYLKDSPLTNVGILQGVLIGEALKEHHENIQHVFCSPSFRCVQTCDAVLRGLGKKDELKIKLEPGLFEWLVWYSEILPDWLTADELIAAGYNIDKDYKPFVPQSELSESRENCEQYYLRSSFVTQSALAVTMTGSVLFVGHSATGDVCSRELVGESPRNANDMTKLIQKIPYCGLTVVTENGDKWEIIEPPCPPITHSNNQRFDWKILRQ